MLIKDLLNIDLDLNIENITTNSKDVTFDTIFVCIRGNTFDGHDYIEEAIFNGASFIVAERPITFDIPHIVVDNSKVVLQELLLKLYPLDKIKIVGVTGTDGKTTTSLIAKHLLESKYNVGYIGTNGIIFDDFEIETNNTTPSIDELYKALYYMQESKVDIVVMEVSSHAIVQDRIHGLNFHLSVFTNISKEHQDYHKSIDEYVRVKSRLLSRTQGVCIINADDTYSNHMMTAANTFITYGVNKYDDYYAKKIKSSTVMTTFMLNGEHNIETNLFGSFNVYNILAAIAVAREFNVPIEEIISSLKNVPQIEGRQHFFKHNERYFLIDFAHTPNAIKTLLKSVNKVHKKNIIIVLGSCGERDKLKRPEMTAMAYMYADKVIVTDEDPKNEDHLQILRDLTTSVKPKSLFTVENRKKAIQLAFEMSKADDLIVIVGKGNEKYQDYGTYKVVHNDIETCLNLQFNS